MPKECLLRMPTPYLDKWNAYIPNLERKGLVYVKPSLYFLFPYSTILYVGTVHKEYDLSCLHRPRSLHWQIQLYIHKMRKFIMHMIVLNIFFLQYIVSQIYHIWNAEYNMVVQTFPNPYITVTSMIKIFGYKYSDA